MNVERLRAVQAEEREADSLRSLPESFYRDVAEYIEDLRERRARAAAEAEDPFGAADVRRLTDEIETAEEVAEAIYERRVGKLVKRASLAAAGMPADEDGLTTEEAALFSDLVAQIEAHRGEVLATFDGKREPSRPDADAAPEDPVDGPGDDTGGVGEADSSLDVGDVMGRPTGERHSEAADERPSDDAPPPPPDEPVRGDDATGETGPDGGDVDETEKPAAGDFDDEPERVTLRITRDVGEVFGVDERVYDLASEDVVTLPAPNAKPLLDRDAAEEID